MTKNNKWDRGLTHWDKIKKHIYFDSEIIISWKGKLYVILSFTFWLPHNVVDNASESAGSINKIWGRSNGQFQITIPFIRFTKTWKDDPYTIFEWGWKTANADMYKER
jgi:hypothetical protein